MKKHHSFAIGNTIRLGVKMTPEQCKRISDGHKGLKKSEETKQKIRLSNIGRKHLTTSRENNPNWKGGITPKNKLIRKSYKYEIWRRDIFIRDRFTCRECGKTHIYIEAHHIKPFAKFPEFRFDRNNGITLCEYCHKKTDSYAKNI